MSMTRITAGVSTAAAVLGLSVHTHAGQPSGPGTAGVTELWEINCLRCHGQRGEGGGAGTSSLLDDEFLSGGADRDLFKSIKEGHPEDGMEPFGQTLSDEQVWGLVVYIRELRERDRRRREGDPRPVAGVYQSRHERFSVETVVERGLDVPWSVDFLPDGRMLIADRPGQLRIHSSGRAGGELGPAFRGTPAVRNNGQGGLMDVAVHPDFTSNGWIYLSFAHRAGSGSGGMTKVVRGRLGGPPDAPAWQDQQTIFQARPEHYTGGGLHFGCRIVFGPPAADGRRHLYFAIGERGRMDDAPRLERPNGKIHRLWDDGATPDDNPFTARDDAYTSIWTFGNRNPQGLALDLEGRLWATEHGPRGGDELNLIEPGRNYGWPEVSFGIHYNGMPFRSPWPAEGRDITMPVDTWTPSIGACGLDVARGPAFPAWKGDLLAGGLSGENVDRLRVRVQGQTPVVVERETLIRGLGRVRDVVCGPDGSVYVVLNGPDKVVRIVPARP
jgi:glucose/arabinose dehydrogenase